MAVEDVKKWVYKQERQEYTKIWIIENDRRIASCYIDEIPTQSIPGTALPTMRIYMKNSARTHILEPRKMLIENNELPIPITFIKCIYHRHPRLSKIIQHAVILQKQLKIWIL